VQGSSKNPMPQPFMRIVFFSRVTDRTPPDWVTTPTISASIYTKYPVLQYYCQSRWQHFDCRMSPYNSSQQPDDKHQNGMTEQVTLTGEDFANMEKYNRDYADTDPEARATIVRLSVDRKTMRHQYGSVKVATPTQEHVVDAGDAR